MSSKKEDIIKIWKESFADSPEYVDMFFRQVYLDEEALILQDAEGRTVSSLLLQEFEMSFHGSLLPVSYLCGAATRRRDRGKGYMSELMRDALRHAAERGDMMVALIPARSALYFFYDKFGFSTVFYTKEQRFTSAHTFPFEGDFEAVRDVDPLSERVREAFDRLQRARSCYIRHSQRDFTNIIADLRMDGGDFVVVDTPDPEAPDGRRIAAMVWAVYKRGDDLLLVNDVMGDSEPARMAALRELRRLHSDTPFLLYGRPTDTLGGRLMPRGMGRVVNARMLLDAVAAAYPDFKCRIRVSDPELPDINSHTYIISRGAVETDDTYDGRLDFDVSIEVLAAMAFSAPATGEMLGFPACRPMLSLMLD